MINDDGDTSSYPTIENSTTEVLQNHPVCIDPTKLLHLCENLSSLSNSIQVQILINNFIQDITNSPYVFIISILSGSEEGLIQVIGDKILDKELRFSMTSENIKNVADHGFQFLITDINRDFPEVIEMVVGNKHNTLIFYISNSKSLSSSSSLSSSLSSSSSSSSAAPSAPSPPTEQLINEPTNLCSTRAIDLQQQLQPISFLVCIAGDEQLRDHYKICINETFKFTLGHLLTSIELAEEKRVRGQCERLLVIARSLLRQIGDLGQLLKSVMAEAKDIAGAERCSLFLLDKYSGELVSMVFDGDEASKKEVRIENGQGIAGHVSKTGKLLNIRNAYLHPMFFKGVDEQTGFKTRNILCFPICDENSIIGVAQLCNKINGFHFDKCDEQVATAFSIYCGIAIMHAVINKTVQKAEARHKVSQELLLYHMKVPEDVVQTLAISLENSGEKIIDNFTSFTFLTRELESLDTIKVVLQMFVNLDLITKFKIHRDKLVRFLIVVQKGYRETIAYHNWYHAFTVGHFGYSLIVNLKLIERNILSDLEAFSFLISCFCHDIDHRGIGNSYHTMSKSSIDRLYSNEGSVNERHHLAQSMYILNEENCKILDGLTDDELKKFNDTMEKFILATDLAIHIRIFNKLKNLKIDNFMDNLDEVHSLLMTCSDLSDQIKPWPVPYNVSNLIYQEFFAQGDLEKKLGLTPDIMMDRQKARIPELQIVFITQIIRPTFKILGTIFPETKFLMDIIKDTQAHWIDIKSKSEPEQ